MFNRELRFVELIGTLRDRHLLIDPELTTGDKLLPYTTYEMHRAEENGTCRNKSLPESVLLEPNKPTVVDWFVLIDDPSLDAWLVRSTFSR